jgi:hypothetical protein
LGKTVTSRVGRFAESASLNTLLAASVISASTAYASPAPFTAEQCKVIAATISQVLSTVGADTLSIEFRTSLRNFVVTEGKLTCGGSRDILTPTTKDIAAFNTIRTILLGGSSPISLEDAGVRSIAAR